MSVSRVEVTVDGQPHQIVIPYEWSGAVTVTVNVHRGRASRKILVSRETAVMLDPTKEVSDGQAG